MERLERLERERIQMQDPMKLVLKKQEMEQQRVVERRGLQKELLERESLAKEKMILEPLDLLVEVQEILQVPQVSKTLQQQVQVRQCQRSL